MAQPDGILIAGPTASGKSRFAVEMAENVGGEIINTDSMQVYPVLDILTARPDKEDLQRVPHHLYGHAALDRPYSVAQWVDDARVAFDDVTSRGRVPIFVGGTGLYFMALEAGLSRVPPIPPEIRAAIRADLIEQGAAALHKRLEALDSQGAALLKVGDSHRIARALEVVTAHGKPLRDFHSQAQEPGFLTGKRLDRHVLMPERSVLHERINARAEIMIDQPAVDEVKALLALHLPENATVLRAIGVSEISSYICGKQNLADTKNAIKTATRQYAKRQMTWFRNRLDAQWQRH